MTYFVLDTQKKSSGTRSEAYFTVTGLILLQGFIHFKNKINLQLLGKLSDLDKDYWVRVSVHLVLCWAGISFNSLTFKIQERLVSV